MQERVNVDAGATVQGQRVDQYHWLNFPRAYRKLWVGGRDETPFGEVIFMVHAPTRVVWYGMGGSGGICGGGITTIVAPCRKK
jgi:hypothetical protein